MGVNYWGGGGGGGGGKGYVGPPPKLLAGACPPSSYAYARADLFKYLGPAVSKLRYFMKYGNIFIEKDVRNKTM